MFLSIYFDSDQSPEMLQKDYNYAPPENDQSHSFVAIDYESNIVSYNYAPQGFKDKPSFNLFEMNLSPSQKFPGENNFVSDITSNIHYCDFNSSFVPLQNPAPVGDFNYNNSLQNYYHQNPSIMNGNTPKYLNTTVNINNNYEIPNDSFSFNILNTTSVNPVDQIASNNYYFDNGNSFFNSTIDYGCNIHVNEPADTNYQVYEEPKYTDLLPFNESNYHTITENIDYDPYYSPGKSRTFYFKDPLAQNAHTLSQLISQGTYEFIKNKVDSCPYLVGI